jgi:hypothetical protein
MASAPASELSSWCNMPGWRHDRALFDLMHTIHLGTAEDFCAQMVSDLCKHGYQGSIVFRMPRGNLRPRCLV